MSKSYPVGQSLRFANAPTPPESSYASRFLFKKQMQAPAINSKIRLSPKNRAANRYYDINITFLDSSKKYNTDVIKKRNYSQDRTNVRQPDTKLNSNKQILDKSIDSIGKIYSRLPNLTSNNDVSFLNVSPTHPSSHMHKEKSHNCKGFCSECEQNQNNRLGGSPIKSYNTGDKRQLQLPSEQPATTSFPRVKVYREQKPSKTNLKQQNKSLILQLTPVPPRKETSDASQMQFIRSSKTNSRHPSATRGRAPYRDAQQFITYDRREDYSDVPNIPMMKRLDEKEDAELREKLNITKKVLSNSFDQEKLSTNQGETSRSNRSELQALENSKHRQFGSKKHASKKLELSLLLRPKEQLSIDDAFDRLSELTNRNSKAREALSKVQASVVKLSAERRYSKHVPDTNTKDPD